jgi:hypothetical protein
VIGRRLSSAAGFGASPGLILKTEIARAGDKLNQPGERLDRHHLKEAAEQTENRLMMLLDEERQDV